MIDEHAGQLLADRLVQQRANDRRIDAAGQAEKNVVATHLLTHARDGVSDDISRTPARLAAADLPDKAFEKLRALQRVGYFRMELNTVIAARLVRHPRQRHAVGESGCDEAFRQLIDAVAVAHPNVEQRPALFVTVIAQAIEQTARRRGGDLRITE